MNASPNNLPPPGAAVRIQSVLFNTGLAGLLRSVASLRASVAAAIRDGLCARADLRFGDCSPVACLDRDALARLEAAADGVFPISYEVFGANLGSAQGHNRLAAETDADFILVENPDVVHASGLISRLLAAYRNDGIGMVEARQAPIEHPKDYDPFTGETAWASTACVLIPRPLFRELGGFDAANFFLYCDDVDFSWMVREAGYKVIFQPAATVFHDKRLSNDGRWQTSTPERRYSAEGALMLAHKWSRPDLVDRYLAGFRTSPDPEERAAAAHFDERRDNGQLPAPRDPEHRIGQFEEYFYAKHRYAL